MKISIDFDSGKISETIEGKSNEFALNSPDGFRTASKAWLRAGWDAKYVYSFSWMGRPIIQLPDDVLRMQELIYSLKPSVIIETGVAHGGSLIFYASLFKAMGLKSKVIGVDIEIRPHNRQAIEKHELAEYIDLVEGSSTDSFIINQVSDKVGKDDKVLVILDSNHTYAHVLEELNLYSKFVSVGSYIVSTDGIMKDLAGAPRSSADWATNNPYCAAVDFLKSHSNFVCEQPSWPFNESSNLKENVTYWPGAWLKRVKT